MDDLPVSRALKITFVPAQHFSARGLFDRDRSLWGGYMIKSHGRFIYFGGDSGYSTHFSDIKAFRAARHRDAARGAYERDGSCSRYT